MQAHEMTYDEMEAEAARLGVVLPIEQTEAWSRLEATVEGRTPWGCVRLSDDAGETVALVAFTDYLTHGYHYLRSPHGPVWLQAPDPETERAGVCALRDHVHRRDRKVAFIRMGVDAELDVTSPTLSMIPYDSTVIMDITGSDEDILSRMKARGRRDVRKALRESPATYADETERATASFAEYYDVMLETAERDGFTPSPSSDYENMISILGPDHCRVFAGRVDGSVVTWTITTISGTHAVRYYGASRAHIPHRSYVTDGLIYFESCTLSKRGMTTYDMMGIGSESFPGLNTLNTFKCKFANDVTHVAPDRDVPVRGTLYSSLQLAKRLRG